MNISNFIEELKRRNVFKVATAYAIAGWLIIQIATSVFPAFNFPDWTQQFVIIMVGIGFPLSLIFAWAFELTPEGLKKSKEVEITDSVTSRTGKKLNGIIIGVLSVALFFVLVERVFFAKSSILEDASSTANFDNASIAVLPFVNMSDDRANEFFSDGLSEELLNGLAKLEDIQVAGRTSSFQFKGTNPDLRDVGTQLGVKHILEGSVRKSGDRVRITAQLIQADNGFHLWSETYDRELTASDVFDIQEEITRRVVQELKIRLLPEEEVALSNIPTQDIEAYNSFLEANQLLASRQADDIEDAIELFKESIRIDPSFAKAHARLAFAYLLLWDNGNFPTDEAKVLMRDYAEQALFLDGNDGDAYRALGSYYSSLEVDYKKAETALLRAIELMPNHSMAKNSLGVLYGNQGYFEKRDSVIQIAYELDPLNNVIGGNYTSYLIREERWEDALTLLNEIIERDPNYSSAYLRIANIQSNPPYGNLDKAFQNLYEVYKTNRDDPDFIAGLFYLSEDIGAQKLADFFSSQLLALYPDNLNALNLRLRIANAKQEHEKAMNILQELKERGSDLDKTYHQQEAILLYYLGELDAAIQLMERFNPDILNRNYIFKEQDVNPAFVYAPLLEEANRVEDFEVLVSKICDFSQTDAAQKRAEGKEIAAFFSSINCDAFSEDPQPVINAIDEMYFELGAKTGWTTFKSYNEFIFGDIYDDPEFIALFDRIYADLGEMRRNVIEYLKAEGEWREEWGEEN